MKTFFSTAALLLWAVISLNGQNAADTPLARFPVYLESVPASETLQISVGTTEPVTLYVFESNGRLRFRKKFEGATRIFLSEYPSGTYTLRFRASSGMAERRIVLQEEN